MKTFTTSVLMAASGFSLGAATTIDPANPFAYGANVGWIDGRGDGANGAVIGAFTCSGFVYIANAGWVHLGSGAPANGVRYQNDSPTDYGVNHDGIGNLHGYAYGANIGWLTFTNRDANGGSYPGPSVDLISGRLQGYIWSANCGWISLSNQFAVVRTSRMDCGPDADGDGIPDAWERQFAPDLGVLTAPGDVDGDGHTNLEEFESDTDPLDPNSVFKFWSISKPGSLLPTRLEWTSSPTRQYRVTSTSDLLAPFPWLDVGPGLIPGSNGATTIQEIPATSDAFQFFVIEALKPLP